jgi:hypothetical protein
MMGPPVIGEVKGEGWVVSGANGFGFEGEGGWLAPNPVHFAVHHPYGAQPAASAAIVGSVGGKGCKRRRKGGGGGGGGGGGHDENGMEGGSPALLCRIAAATAALLQSAEVIVHLDAIAALGARGAAPAVLEPPNNSTLPATLTTAAKGVAWCPLDAMASNSCGCTVANATDTTDTTAGTAHTSAARCRTVALKSRGGRVQKRTMTSNRPTTTAAPTTIAATDTIVLPLSPTQNGVELIGKVVTNPTATTQVVGVGAAQFAVPSNATFVCADLMHGTRLLRGLDRVYDVIVLDPPWENKSARRGNKYNTLPNDALFQIPLPTLARPGVSDSKCAVCGWVEMRVGVWGDVCVGVGLCCCLASLLPFFPSLA